MTRIDGKIRRSMIRQRPYRWICILGLVYGIVSTVFYGGISVATHCELAEVKREIRHGVVDAYSDEHKYRLFYAQELLPITIILVILSVMGVGSTVVLSNNVRRGIFLLRCYGMLQSLCSILFGVVLMEAIYHSAADSVFYIGGFIGFLGCMFPALIFIVLRNPRSQQQTKR